MSLTSVTYDWTQFFQYLFGEVIHQGPYEKNRQSLLRATSQLETLVGQDIMFDLCWGENTVSVEGTEDDVDAVVRALDGLAKK